MGDNTNEKAKMICEWRWGNSNEACEHGGGKWWEEKAIQVWHEEWMKKRSKWRNNMKKMNEESCKEEEKKYIEIMKILL